MKKYQKCTPPLILVCMSSFFFMVTVPISSAASYVPREVILLNCGASGEVEDPDGRTWTGDVGSEYAPSLNVTGIAVPSRDPSVPALPYMTARVFSSPFTYSFPLGPGRVFLRLHLYPSDYSGRAASDALFAVTSGPYALLNNFSPSQTAAALATPYFVREYSINVSATGGVLNLTFAPSNLSAGSSYAFVNGIEIVSIPEIFSTAAGASLVTGGATSVPYSVDPNAALQTMYRLNVGGRAVSPVQDSGLYRRWEDDTPYLLGAATGVITFSTDPNVSITYTDTVPRCIAPVPVYSTARQMSGPSPSVNMNHRLTWTFRVDEGFYYLVRMHFCEIQHPMTAVNLRVFDIYLSNQTAKLMADVIGWSGGIGRPTYQDYVVITAGTGVSDLWVALHPDLQSSPAYVDVILNGLEIFKLQKYDGSLAGPNPDPQSDQSTGEISTDGAASNPQRRREPKGSRVPVLIAGSVIVAVVVVLLGFFWLFRRFRRRLHERKRVRDVGAGDGPFRLSPPVMGQDEHNQKLCLLAETTL